MRRLLCLVGIAILPVVAAADTIYTNTDTSGNFTFLSTLTLKAGNLYTYQLEIINGNAQGTDVNGFSASLFTDALTVTSSTLPAGWESAANEKIDNGSGLCTGVSHPGSLCADRGNSSPYFLAGGADFTFMFSGSYAGTLADPYHLMANSDRIARGGYPFFALSDDLTWTCTGDDCAPPPPQVPEPASLTLLGSGIVALGYLRRRFFR